MPWIEAKKPKLTYKSATIAILDILLGIPEAFFSATTDRKSIYNAIESCSDHQLTVANICNFFNSMRKRGYIEVTNTQGQESVRFTHKAQIKLLENISEKLGTSKRNRFVSFDIPESLSRQRDLFRSAIKRIGFKQIQKSLWVCNRNVGKLVELAANEYRVNEYVVYIVSEMTDIDDTINKLLSPSANTDSK